MSVTQGKRTLTGVEAPSQVITASPRDTPTTADPVNLAIAELLVLQVVKFTRLGKVKIFVVSPGEIQAAANSIRTEELNPAPTDFAASMLTVHGPETLVHAPDHPIKVLPESGVAVSVTIAPLLKKALHALPQEMPYGLLMTLPPPVPVRAMSSNIVLATGVTEFEALDATLAPTAFAALTVKV